MRSTGRLFSVPNAIFVVVGAKQGNENMSSVVEKRDQEQEQQQQQQNNGNVESSTRQKEDEWPDKDYLSLDPSVRVSVSVSVSVGAGERNKGRLKNDNSGSDDMNEEDDGTNAFRATSDDIEQEELPPWNPQIPPPWMEHGGGAVAGGAAGLAAASGGELEGHYSYNRNHSNKRKRIHPVTALHNEIVAFVQLMEPLPSEIEQREKLVERVQTSVHKVFEKGTRLEVFGSQATGLFLPTSDIDLVIITVGDDNEEENKKTSTNNNDNRTISRDDDDSEVSFEKEEYFVKSTTTAAKKSPLRTFAEKALQQPEWVNDLSYLELVEKTRIPLVKFTVADTNISVDVSFNQPTGPPAAILMKRYLDALPPLRPLTIVLKYFLAARGLNEPYTGGVGSFMLQLLIVAFLQQRERDAVNFQRPSVYNLGALLLDFFELYGVDFNHFTTGISVRNDGFFFPKGAADRHATFWKRDRLGLLALENPLDPTLDVGQSSFRYQTVQRAFAVAYKTLLAHLTAEPHEMGKVSSVLAMILPPTKYMAARLILKRRDRPLAAGRQISDGGNRNPKRQRRR